MRDSKNRKHDRDPSSPLSPTHAGSPSAMDVDKKAKTEEKEGEEDESSSEDEGAPPRREQPQAMTFGEDPSTFPDPTIYEILDVKPGMSEEEKKAIFSVAVYPPSDLGDLIAGDPPDHDYSSAKPSRKASMITIINQVLHVLMPVRHAAASQAAHLELNPSTCTWS